MSKSQQLLEAVEFLQRTDDEYALLDYHPYPKQMEMHAAGLTFRERGAICANQVGKSTSGGAEVVFHTTGLYPEPGTPGWPDGWPGHKFKPTKGRPLVVWVCGKTATAVRNTLQRKIMGPEGAYGSGLLPAHCIHGTTRTRGVAETLDKVYVNHINGSISEIEFHTYAEDVETWYGVIVDFFLLDEEPKPLHYDEAMLRMTNALDRGRALLTFTPLGGQTNVVDRFYPTPDSQFRHLTEMEWKDAPHIWDHPDVMAELLAGIPEWQRDARTRGIPLMGEGMVFEFPEEDLKCEPFSIPNHFKQIIGMDFGWDHPTAIMNLAIDRGDDGLDHVYVTHVYKQSRQPPVIHAEFLRQLGIWKPVSWPHDGNRAASTEGKNAGKSWRQLYAELGVKMLPQHATYIGGGNTIEPGIVDMRTLMQTGRFHVFSNCDLWFDEYRGYHMKDNKIVDRNDDLMSATRMACMMRRLARTNSMEAGQMRVADSDWDPFSMEYGT